MADEPWVAAAIAAVVLASLTSGLLAFQIGRGSGTTSKTLNDRVAELQSENEGLRSDLVQLGASGKGLATKVDDLRRREAAGVAEISQLRASVSDLSAQVAEQKAAVAALTTAKAAVDAQLTQLTAPRVEVHPTVTYGTVLRYAEDWFSQPPLGAYLLVVDVSVTNDADVDAYFSTHDFKLKDPDSTVYAILAESSVAGQPRFQSGVEVLPGGRTQIRDQSIAPGEVVRGSLVFYVTDPSVKTFTISYYGDVKQLTA